MKYPQRSATVSTEALGDGLAVFDREQGQSYVLNATSALVFQYCDGQTSSQQLTEFLRQKFNLPPAEAEKLMRLALDELQTANLLQPGFAQMPPPAATFTRRQALTTFCHRRPFAGPHADGRAGSAGAGRAHIDPVIGVRGQ